MTEISTPGDPRGGMHSASWPTNRFTVRAASDPQTIMRIAGLFAQRGLVPRLLHASAHDEDDLLITIEARLPGTSVAKLLLEKIRSLVLVASAEMTEGHNPC